MAQTVSAKKRIRQDEVRRERNRARKSRIRTQVRKVREAADAGDAEQAALQLRAAERLVDRVAAKGTIHPNKAARLKSRLARRVNKGKSG